MGDARVGLGKRMDIATAVLSDKLGRLIFSTRLCPLHMYIKYWSQLPFFLEKYSTIHTGNGYLKKSVQNPVSSCPTSAHQVFIRNIHIDSQRTS